MDNKLLSSLNLVDDNIYNSLDGIKTIKISKVTPAYGRLILTQREIPFSIIRHTAIGFDALAWREYLQAKVPICMLALIL